jgi:phosphate:Na+ symporter
MALAVHGLVSPSGAVPVVLGANLGSALVVLAVSLPKRREARRLALANSTLHLVGCAGAIALSLPTIGGHSPLAWLVEPLVAGTALGDLPANGAAHIAMTHTLYNVLAGLPFLFFPRRLLCLVDRVLPALPATEDVKPFLLDRNLVSVPALALRQATEETIYMTEICRKVVAEAYDSFRYSDLDLSEQVVRREEVIANIHREVTEYLSDVTRNQLSRRDASQLEVLQTAVSCLMRIGGLGERYRDLTMRKIEEAVKTAEEVERELNDVYDLVMGQFGNILSLLREQDPKTEENAVKMVERLAKLSSRIEGLWRQRVEQTPPEVSAVSVHLQTLVYHEAFGILFRIASQLAHIAERMRILRPDRF